MKIQKDEKEELIAYPYHIIQKILQCSGAIESIAYEIRLQVNNGFENIEYYKALAKAIDSLTDEISDFLQQDAVDLEILLDKIRNES